MSRDINIKDLTKYSNSQLYRLENRMKELYPKHSTNPHLIALIERIDNELKTRGLEIWELEMAGGY